MQYNAFRKVIRIGLVSLACAAAILAYGYEQQIISHTTLQAAAIVTSSIPLPPTGSGGGGGTTSPCDCFRGIMGSGGLNVVVTAFSDSAGKQITQIVDNTQATAGFTNAIKTYLTTTLTKQEGLAMNYADTYSQQVFAEIQAKKGECDSYKAQFGAEAKGQSQICRSFVENWLYAFADVAKNVRKDIAQEMERATSFLTSDETQAIINQVPLLQDKPFQTDFTDNVIAKSYMIQLPNGQIARPIPNTTLAGAMFHSVYFNTQRLIQIVQNNTDQRIAQSTQELRDQATAGQGALSIDEPVYDITDARTGQIIGHRYSSTVTETMLNQEIKSAVTAGLDKALSSTFSPGTAGNFFPGYDPKTGLYTGGIAALRGLGNSANGGPGFFATGPGVGTIPLPAICYVNFADATKTLGVNQTDAETATITLVGKTKMQNVAFSADDGTIVDISPSSIAPAAGQEQTTPQQYQVTLKGLKQGTTNINATVSIANTSTTCQTDSPLVVTVQDACTITTNPQLFVPADLTNLIWNNVGSPRESFSFQIPSSITVTKNTDAGLSFDSINISSGNAFVATSSPGFLPKSLFTFFDTFAQASSTITLTGPGTTSLDVTADSASSITPLCTSQIPAGIGTRCLVQSCQGATTQTNVVHECVQNQETTEFCDGITGYQATDGNNAWCVDAVPSQYQNICATQ